MANGQQLAELNFQSFMTWLFSRTDSDFRQMVSRGCLSRKEISTQCGFSTSALNQNPRIRQNSAYDHVTSGALVAKAKNMALSKSSLIFGGDLSEVKVRVVARRDGATGILRHMTAHVTDYGMCTHDYAASPFQIHQDCLNQ